MAQAEAYQTRNAGRKPVAMTSREAVQMAEDSRVIAVKRQEEEALNTARLRSSEREASAENGRAAAQSETDRVKRDAEAARLRAQADTERLTREKNAQASASQADADRVKRENDARMAAAANDADQLKIQNDARETAANDRSGPPQARERYAKGGQPGRTRCRSQAAGAVRSRQGGTEVEPAGAIQRHSSDAGYRARPGC